MIKQIITVFLFLILITSCGTAIKKETPAPAPIAVTKVDPSKYGSTITEGELKELLFIYASDDFEGRETGEPGQKKAVEYLKSQYLAIGIPSPLGGDDYFQEVPLEKQKVAEAQITVGETKFESFDDHIVLRLNKNLAINANEVVYVGYGIDDDTYSDYENLDVEGKVVLAKAGEPKDANGNFITTGDTKPTKWTNGRQSIASKRDAAERNGAAVFLLVDDELFSRYSNYYRNQAESGTSGRLSLKGTTSGIDAVLMINAKLGKAIYSKLNESDTATVVETDMSLSVKNNSETITSENVVAFIKGSEKPDEIIVISAHLDHEGIKNGEVYNGADDDGSGTVALVEIAEAFKTAQSEGNGPKRSILFLHVTGEEKGLLGSRHYTDNDPVFPLENTIANLNIDMIGRSDPKRTEGSKNYVYLIGSDKLSTELHEISEQVNSKFCNVELDYTYNDENDPNRFYYRSDHYNFAKNNVPVIFYFNGTHADYHRPSDTPDKIEYDLLTNRTRLVFHTAWELANRDNRIIADKAEIK